MTGADATHGQDAHEPPATGAGSGIPDRRPLAGMLGVDRADRGFRLGFFVVVAAVVSGLATYLILTGLTPITPTGDVVFAVLLLNAAVIIAMLALIAWQVHGLMVAWRERVPGARLHVRIVALFSVIAALPAILLAIAATTTFSRSLDNVFSARTRAIIQSSLDVAQAYVDDHGQVLRAEIASMARDLDSASDVARESPAQFRNLLLVQAGLRNIPAAFVVSADGKAVVSAISDPAFAYVAPPPEVLSQAAGGQTVLLSSPTTNRVAAVIPIEALPGTFLYVMRGFSPEVMRYARRASEGLAEYEALRKTRGGLHVAHALMYATISLTALLVAIWVGLWFASRFVAPIGRVMLAAREVSQGNLEVRLPIIRGEGDLRRLSQAFNTMTSEIQSQRDALLAANTELSERGAFIEAVLSGVSAGVIGVDGDGRVTLVNRSAEALLAAKASDIEGRLLAEAVPAFAAILERGEAGGLKPRQQDELTLSVEGQERTFAVRVTREQGPDGTGSVVTFDDVTELVAAQRTTAWADVARRIAHEIKNPLTPIQLSAERIRRRYDKVIVEDRETFEKLTGTIVRQVENLKRMVDEFAAFARLPEPQMETTDLREAVQDPVVLFRESHPQIEFALDLPAEPVLADADRRQIAQALTNLVKNATEAIQQVADGPDAPEGYKGRIETRLRIADGRAEIEVVDNGPGLQRHNRQRLLEPYMTTKAKGTGVGLAIVQKIVEQHGGMIVLDDAPPAPGRPRGALIRIVLPLRRSEPARAGPGRAAAE